MPTDWQPKDRPKPYWTAPDDWYEFFHFVCPSCKRDYVAEQGSDVVPACNPHPAAITSKWDVRTSKVAFSATVVCTCLAKFDVNGTN